MIWNQWYTACASSRLGAAPRAVRVLDRDLALWRDASGTARAVLDRCCHRGYRLSRGRVVGDELECGLHGWRYDAAGRCVRVPSLGAARVPPDFEVPAFACLETDGYVWVWMGRAGAQPRGTPAIPGFGGRSWLQGCVDIACAAARGVEINLDGAHVYFVHATHPAAVAFRASANALSDARQELRVSARGLVVFWPPVGSAADAIPDTASRIAFELPYTVRFANPRGAKTLILQFVPTGAACCRLEYLMSFDQPGAPRVVWIDRIPEIFAEDRAVLEIIQGAATGAGGTHSVEADAAGLVARRILHLAESGKWERGGAAVEESRRMIQTRRMETPPLIDT